MKIRCISDLHNNCDKLVEFIKDESQYDLAMQLGDFGGFTIYNKLIELNPSKFVFYGGNHESWNYLLEDCGPTSAVQKWYLGRYGRLDHLIPKAYWVDGAFSINRKFLTAGLNWWPWEEISTAEYPKIIKDYCEYKPEIMFSHEAPRSVAPHFSSPSTLLRYGFDPAAFTTNTSELLQLLYGYHQPKLWIFAHMHRSQILLKDKTVFQCSEALNYIDLVI